jgi:sugar (pentulose or hexulose) kinase
MRRFRSKGDPGARGRGRRRRGRHPLVRDLIARHAGVHVVTGATEATALGNAMLQGISCGRFHDLADARAWARRG